MNWKELLATKYPWLFNSPPWRLKEGEDENKRYPVCIDVDDGWKSLIEDLARGLDDLSLKVSPEDLNMMYVVQIKEKFGGLRFYMSSCTEEMYDLIAQAENDSYSICEKCGKSGKNRTGGWYKTLCDEHARELGYEYDED